MSRYVLTQEQLDKLQEQINHISRLYHNKEDRIKTLQTYKVRLPSWEVTDLINTIEKLQEEVNYVKKKNKELIQEIDATKTYEKELKLLLQEERKLREYSEALAEQVELKCAEETLLKELTTELCQLQKEEIAISNKRIWELQKKIKRLNEQEDGNYENKVNKKTEKSIKVQRAQLKEIIRKLQAQLLEVYTKTLKTPKKSKEEEKFKRELEFLLEQIANLFGEVKDIEHQKENLYLIKKEIESRKKFVSFNEL